MTHYYRWGGAGWEWIRELLYPREVPDDAEPFSNPGEPVSADEIVERLQKQFNLEMPPGSFLEPHFGLAENRNFFLLHSHPEDHARFQKGLAAAGWLAVLYRVDLQWVALPVAPEGIPRTDAALLQMIRDGKGRILASAEVLSRNGTPAYTTVQLETHGTGPIEVVSTINLFVVPVLKAEGTVQVNILFETEADTLAGREATQLKQNFQGESEHILAREEHGDELYITVAGLRLHIFGESE